MAINKTKQHVVILAMQYWSILGTNGRREYGTVLRQILKKIMGGTNKRSA